MASLLWRSAGVAALGLTCAATDCVAASPACFNADPVYPESDAFRTTGRWTTTAQSGSGLTQGQPTTITWSIVPDGTSVPSSTHGNSVAAGSVLVSRFDAAFGINTATAGTSAAQLAQRPWYAIFSQSFTRWSQLAAVSYVYVGDDGAGLGSSGSSTIRGDVRISSVTINGASGVLAYNYYPSSGIGGDMVIDAADIVTSRIASSSNNYRYGRNMVMHEHGHGLGIMHFESNDSSGLMEPYLSTGFDGPQFDDIMSAQRLYGDVLERNGGNDTAATAFDLGTFGHGVTRSKGTNADDAVVASTETDFVSIDDETDKDYYKITLAFNSKLTLTLTPKGPTYYEAPQTTPATTQVALNTAAFSDLVLTLYGSNGTTVIDSENLNGLGVAETISGLDVLAGVYYVGITGLTADKIQMYRLDVTSAVPEPGGMALATLAAGWAVLRRRRVA